MPQREAGEPINTYIARFVRDRRERKKFPELKQRLAVGFSEARRKRERGAS